MSKYFMQDTRLAAFERMMMETNRQFTPPKPRKYKRKSIPHPIVNRRKKKSESGGR